MKIRMLKTMNGSPDGIEVKTYVEDQVYDLPESLAKVFTRHKWGKRLRETKNTSGAPENKAK